MAFSVQPHTRDCVKVKDELRPTPVSLVPSSHLCAVPLSVPSIQHWHGQNDEANLTLVVTAMSTGIF